MCVTQPSESPLPFFLTRLSASSVQHCWQIVIPKLPFAFPPVRPSVFRFECYCGCAVRCFVQCFTFLLFDCCTEKKRERSFSSFIFCSFFFGFGFGCFGGARTTQKRQGRGGTGLVPPVRARAQPVTSECVSVSVCVESQHPSLPFFFL